MISLSVSNLRKTYGIDLIFDNVSFAINEREKVAIVGANGAGKTTLFNIIAGIEPKDSGDIFIAKDSSLGYMSQNVNIVSDKTLIQETLSVFEDLIKLPGVGRKTANVVRSVAWGYPAIAVDTHVFRVSNRLNLAKGKKPLDVELELQKTVPKEKWSACHHWLIWHGRKFCHARNPDCKNCFLSDVCPSNTLKKI